MKSLVLAVLIFGVACTVLAEDVSIRKYPPYPNVGEYELPWPSKHMRQASITAYQMPDGDYIFTYFKRWQDAKRSSDVKVDYATLSFFSGEKSDLEGAGLDEFAKAHRDQRIDPLKSGAVKFRDGSQIRVTGRGGDCSPSTFWSYLEYVDKEQNLLAEKSLLYLLPTPIHEDVPYVCERNKRMKGKRVTVKVQGINPRLVPLDDETFLAYDVDGNLILRLDQQLLIKKDLLNQKVFVVDRAEMDQYVQDYLKEKKLPRTDQTHHDAVYNYVENHRKAGMK